MKSKRIKKIIVTPEQRRAWLKRHDQGESILDIANKDGFDVRTVRRHVDQGQQERERRDARLTVLKDALERHYSDLCVFAEKLEIEVSKEQQISLRNQRMWTALKQHIPRSLLWSYLKKWDDIIQDRDILRKKTKERLKNVLGSDAKLKKLASENEGVLEFMNLMLGSQLETWGRGWAGLNLGDNFAFQTQGDGSNYIKYGNFLINNISESMSLELKSLIKMYEKEIKGWDEYKSFSKVYTGMARLKAEISDEIAIITLRRVVPSKCLYCPL